MPNYTKTIYNHGSLHDNRSNTTNGAMPANGMVNTSYTQNDAGQVEGKKRRRVAGVNTRKLSLPHFCLSDNQEDPLQAIKSRRQICTAWMIKCYSLVSSTDGRSDFSSMHIKDLNAAKSMIEKLDEASGFDYEGKRLSDLLVDTKLQTLVANLSFPEQYVLYDEVHNVNPCFMRIVENGERICHLKGQCNAHKDGVCDGILHMKEHRSVSYCDLAYGRASNVTILYPRFECKKNIPRDLRPLGSMVVALRPKDIACGVFVITFRLLANIVQEFKWDSVDNLADIGARYNLRKNVVNDCYRIWRFVNYYHRATTNNN